MRTRSYDWDLGVVHFQQYSSNKVEMFKDLQPGDIVYLNYKQAVFGSAQGRSPPIEKLLQQDSPSIARHDKHSALARAAYSDIGSPESGRQEASVEELVKDGGRQPQIIGAGGLHFAIIQSVAGAKHSDGYYHADNIMAFRCACLD